MYSMASFGKRSFDNLVTCHPDIQATLKEAVETFDFSVLEGARSQERQTQLFKEGKSKIDGINKKSYHQVTEENPLSMAVDVAPYPIDWNDEARFRTMAKHIFKAHQKLLAQGKVTHALEWGGHWKKFIDRPHFQIRPIV